MGARIFLTKKETRQEESQIGISEIPLFWGRGLKFTCSPRGKGLRKGGGGVAPIWVMSRHLRKPNHKFFMALPGNLPGNFAGILQDLCGPANRDQKFREDFGAFFVRKFAIQSKSFVPTSFCRCATLKVSLPYQKHCAL